MVFSSLTFLCFFLPLVLLLHSVFRSIKARNALLLVFSLLFYAWGEPVWVFGMVFVTLVNWFASLVVARSREPKSRRTAVFLASAVSLSFLVYFKYAAFFVNFLAGVFRLPLSLEPAVLPIGVSFYTFQALTYTVDVYRKRARPQSSPFLALLYISFFPQLIAGPIVQYGDVAGMLKKRNPTSKDIYEGFSRFIVGLGKKVLLANLCGEAVGALPAAGEAQSVVGAWLMILFFALQVYFDFSGYSDMAIGMGRAFGFRFLENFNYPYISKSISEFWRRWHMSLGAFFRDYVYIPLGGSRVGRLRLIFNLLVVWCLTGLWHGASWNFVAWGLYYGVLIVIERMLPDGVLERFPALLRQIGTLVLVLFGWVFFYYESFADGLSHIGVMLGGGASGIIDAQTVYALKNNAVLLVVSALACLPILPAYRTFESEYKLGRRISGGVSAALPVALTAVLALSFSFLVGQSFNPFLYFRF